MDIQSAMNHFNNDGNRMFNLTRLIFYMEHAMLLSFSDFIQLLAQLKRITLIQFVLMYVISDIGATTSGIISEALEHYNDFGKLYLNLDPLPVFPAIAECDFRFY